MIFIKAQAAAEYLVLLAMILIVALIGVILLGGFTESSSSAMEAEAKTYWMSARPLSITEWTQFNSTIFLKIRNTEPKRIVLKSISVGNQTTNLGVGWTLAPGAEKTIAISSMPTCSASYDYFSYNVTFVYDTSDIAGISQRGSHPIAGRCFYD